MSVDYSHRKEYSSLTEQNITNITETKTEGSIFDFKQPTEWQERWFLSSNAKDIGTLYLMFALFSGLVGTAFSVLIRLELSGPGVQYIADNQLYNAIITAHAILMIFFMVEKNFNIFKFATFLSLLSLCITAEWREGKDREGK